jgi:Cft2 family RNA processing exonuclease
MEATYGNPFYAFPEREDTYGNIVSWVIKQIRENQVPIFQLYSVGKAQEVIALLNDFTNLPVVVDPPIARASNIYSKYDRKLVFLDAAEEEGQELLRHGNCAYLISNGNSSIIPTERKVARSVVTGWSLRFKTSNGAFPLSSHADYPHLIDYVKEVNPSRVYTCFGSSEVLAQNIRKECKIAARPLPTIEQTSLMNFIHG